MDDDGTTVADEIRTTNETETETSLRYDLARPIGLVLVAAIVPDYLAVGIWMLYSGRPGE